MRNSDDRNFFFQIVVVLIAIPVVGVLIAVCMSPSTPEEKVESDNLYTEWAREDLVTFSPRSGVECYVLRGHGDSTPRVMSCVTLATESK